MGKIHDRILKLQALAAGTASESEAETAARLAMRLMFEHAISQAELDAARAQVEDPLIRADFLFDGTRLVRGDVNIATPGKTANWKRRLMGVIAEYLDIRCSYFQSLHRAGSFYGHASDVERAIRLYGVCAMQIENGAHTYAEQIKREAWELGETVSRGRGKQRADEFKHSAVWGLSGKLRALRAEMSEAIPEAAALVLSRKQKVDAWVDSTYSFAAGEPLSRTDFSSAGYQFGSDISLRESAEIDGAEIRRLT